MCLRERAASAFEIAASVRRADLKSGPSDLIVWLNS